MIVYETVHEVKRAHSILYTLIAIKSKWKADNQQNTHKIIDEDHSPAPYLMRVRTNR
jgi:hypothetical protein